MRAPLTHNKKRGATKSTPRFSRLNRTTGTIRFIKLLNKNAVIKINPMSL